MPARSGAPATPATDVLLQRIEAFAVSRDFGPSGMLPRAYEMCCSHAKALGPANLPHAALTPAARQSLFADIGRRIFASRRAPSGHQRGRQQLSRCALRPDTIGRFAFAQVEKRRCERGARRDALADAFADAKRRGVYAGSWVVFVRRPSMTGTVASATATEPRYATIVGFYDCSSDTDPERHVKHMNLCSVARHLFPGHTFLFSGSFVASAGHREDRAAADTVIVNARSGSWALAKRVLRAAAAVGQLPDYGDDDALDRRVVRFATPRVARVVRTALLGQNASYSGDTPR